MSLHPEFEERIARVIALRQLSRTACESVLQWLVGRSEIDIASKLIQNLAQNPGLFLTGWYDPPPGGAGALVGRPPEFERMRYDTLRDPKYWPSSEYRADSSSCISLFVSPLEKSTGMIGDYGFTAYLGELPAIRRHLRNCLGSLLEAAETIEPGMSFQAVHDRAQKVLDRRELHNDRTVSQADPLGSNLGHTIPWSYENPSVAEEQIIRSGRELQLRELVRTRRLFVSRKEQFKIPETCAFTFEARLESRVDPSLPNVFFHLLVAFRGGVRTIDAGFPDQ